MVRSIVMTAGCDRIKFASLVPVFYSFLGYAVKYASLVPVFHSFLGYAVKYASLVPVFHNFLGYAVIYAFLVPLSHFKANVFSFSRLFCHSVNIS